VLSVGATHVNVTAPAGLEVLLGEVPDWVSGADVNVDPVLLLPEHPPRTNAMTNKLVN
jgi:hypothetical protein